MTDHEVARRQLLAEIGHWRSAVEALADLDSVAGPAAWAGLETYVQRRLREPLQAAVDRLALDAATTEAAVSSGADLADPHRRVLALRRRYFQVEALIEFYGDAVATRTNPRLAAVLRGLDTLAADSLDVILRPLGIEAPPALVYLAEGPGASIAKAGMRLWDQTSLSPVAAVKLTRHNLGHPTALFHEVGHQAAAQAGLVPELAAALEDALARRSRELAAMWAGWASEVAADVHALRAGRLGAAAGAGQRRRRHDRRRSTACWRVTRTRSRGSGSCSTPSCAARGTDAARGTRWRRRGPPGTRQSGRPLTSPSWPAPVCWRFPRS